SGSLGVLWLGLEKWSAGVWPGDLLRWWVGVLVQGAAVRQREDPPVVLAGHGDFAGVDECVVVVAEEGAVGGVGGSAVGPVDAGVVGFADGRWGGAAWPGAAFVSGDEG